MITRSNLDSSIRLASINAEGSSLSSDRLRLSENDFSLVLSPARASDSGDYFCLVNGKAEPSRVTRLAVQGQWKMIGFTLLVLYASIEWNLILVSSPESTNP